MTGCPAPPRGNAGLRGVRLRGALLRAPPQSADDEHEHGAGAGGDEFDHVRRFGAQPCDDQGFDGGIGHDHLADNPAEQRGARPHEDGEAVEQAHDQGGAGDDQGNADRKTDHQEHQIALRSSGDGDDIVEAHDDIGNGDDAHRPPQMIDRFDAPFALVVRNQELGGDVEQREASDQLLDAYYPGGLFTLFARGASANALDEAYARTMAFTTLMMFQLYNVFNCRSTRRSAFSGLLTNWWLIGAVFLSLLAHLAVIYVPALQAAFHTVALTPGDWVIAAGVGATLLGVLEIAKFALRIARRSSAVEQRAAMPD
jgi:hypothetical protein